MADASPIGGARIPGEADAIVIHQCVVGDCTSKEERPPRQSDGLCRMHVARLHRRGDVNFEYVGENHQNWRGNEVTYAGMHVRLRLQRGPAKNCKCVTCGDPASDWAYDHGDPAEIRDEKTGITFSSDLTHYRPKCRRCHMTEDVFSAAEARRAAGLPHPTAKITAPMVRKIRDLAASGASSGEIARQLDCGIRAVQHVRAGTSWGWLQ